MHAILRACALTLSLSIAAASPANTIESLFQPYAQLLERHVTERALESGGLVTSFDYRAAIANENSRELIDRQRQRLADLDSDTFEQRETALAFWINAYNFFMLAHIVDNAEDSEPVDSVKGFGSLFNPFRVFGQEIFDVAGKRRSLDNIEKATLLGEDFQGRGWKDARVHFAVNCASVGCPPLRDRPYTQGNVDRLLDENTRLALRTPLHLEIDGDTARMTSLFDWYETDFEQAAGSVEAFVVRHLDNERAAAFRNTDTRRHIDYDWQLNSPAHIESWLENNQ